jgi:hypothetical protein
MIGQAKQTTEKKSWAMEKIGKPLMFIGAGFILCKIFDAYTENKKSQRLLS